MTDANETQASEVELNELSTGMVLTPEEEPSEPETQEQEQPAEPQETLEEVKARIAALEAEKAQLAADKERLSGRLGSEKGAKQTFAKLVKKQIEEGLIDEVEAKQLTGYDLKRIEGFINAPDLADNPLEAAKQEFNADFSAFKPTLDHIMKEDTAKFATAFGNYADPEMVKQFIEMPRAERAAYVIEKGKEILEKYGEGGKDAYIAKLEAELSAVKAGKPTPKPVAQNQSQDTLLASRAVAESDVPDAFKRLFM